MIVKQALYTVAFAVMKRIYGTERVPCSRFSQLDSPGLMISATNLGMVD
jgi:hypothetical protein